MTPYDRWMTTEPDDDSEAWSGAFDELRSDPDAVRKADEWVRGTQDGEHYDELEIAMADLHEMDPNKLIGSDLLTKLYRLAKPHGESRRDRLIKMAKEIVEREKNMADEARSETRGLAA